jgi:DNA repair exonuclease SbcCD ATPase subunit
LIAIAFTTFSLPSVAQVTAPPTSDEASLPKEEPASELTLVDVEAALAAVEEDAGIEETVKAALRVKFQQAIADLKDAAANSERATEFRQAMSQAPVATAKLREQLQKLPTAKSVAEVTDFGDFEEFQQELDGKRAELASLNEQLSRVTDELNAEEGRPADISVRIPEAQQELSEVRQQLPAGDDASTGSVADRFLLQAQEAKLVSELDALKQEQQSMSVRRTLQQAKRDLLSRQVENASTAVDAYEESINESVTKQSQAILARAAKWKKELPDGHPALELVTEVEQLANELASVLQDKQAISDAKVDATARLERLVQEQEGISKQLELGQPDREMAELLLKMRDLLNSRERELAREPTWPSLSQTRLAAVLVNAALVRQQEVEEQFAASSTNIEQVFAAKELIAARDDVLGKLRDQYLELLPELASLETERKLVVRQSQ